MLNKKLGLFVMSAAMLGLVACGGGNSSSSSAAGTSQEGSQPAATTEGGETSTPAGDLPAIPEVEGKIAVYFTYEDAEGAVALADIPSWCSPFITGNWNGYATTPDAGALEMQALAGNDHVFYAYLPADGDFGDMGYQITLGYNAASGVGTSKQGINWSYKTMYSDANFPGLDHPVLTKMNDKVYAALNSDHAADPMAFKNALPEPVSAKDTSLKFKIDLGDIVMGDNLEFVVKGSFNGWTTVSVGEADEDGYYYVPLGEEVEGEDGIHHEIIVGTYEMCFGVRNKLVGGEMADKYTLARSKADTNVDVLGGEEEAVLGEDEQTIVSYNITNIVLGMSAIDGDGFEYNVGTLVAPEHAKGTLDEFELPSNDAPLIGNTYVIRLTNTGEAYEGIPYIAGEFTGWQHVIMDEVIEGHQWECIIPANSIYMLVDQDFKFTDGDWDGVEVAPVVEGIVTGNFSVTPNQGDLGVEIAADLSGWAGKVGGEMTEIEELELPEEFLVEFRVHNIVDGIPTKVTIAGDFQGWDPATTELELNELGGFYAVTLDFSDMVVGSKINFKITNGTWDLAVGNHGDNFVETVSYGRYVYEYDADLVTFVGDLVPHVVA